MLGKRETWQEYRQLPVGRNVLGAMGLHTQYELESKPKYHQNFKRVNNISRFGCFIGKRHVEIISSATANSVANKEALETAHPFHRNRQLCAVLLS